MGQPIEFRVLKKYQIDDNKPFARWLVAAKSPFTGGDYDMGDNYVQDVKASAHLVTDPNFDMEQWTDYAN